MDRLSSCYFCGAALDAQLSEYPVVPKRLQSEGSNGKTVVLCDGCRRKLGNVLEEVVAAATDESTAAPDYDGTGFEPIASSEAETTQPTAVAETDDGVDTVSTADEPAQPRNADNGAVDDAATDAGTEDEAADDEPTLTKLEYNKVMRLLKNREFPVDRLEIREVATSAYQIDPEEFDAVVDAAIDRGLIAQRDGQFVAPDGR